MLDQTIVVGPFQCNCRLLACRETGRAVLVDPGDEPEKILQAIEGARTPSGAKIQVEYLFHTHAHLDHIGGTRGVREKHPAAKIAVHGADEPLYQQLKMQGQLFGIDYEEPLPIDLRFEHGQTLEVGTLKFSVIHNPGHSPGSVSLRLHEDTGAQIRETLFSGDTLFRESVGRTDLWGADQDAMFKNIRERLFTLDGDTRVCPGHGPESTIDHEKRQNPFFR